MNKNPLTFKHIENGAPLPDPAAGAPPVSFGQSGFGNSEVHASGEVWCSMLWECYTALLRNPGLSFTEAQNRMKDYLVASLKITPGSPTFVEARNALLAVAASNDNDDFLLFSEAFAKRGLGKIAIAPDRNSPDHNRFPR